ncbi:hypothetical protein HGRIS_001782 [Hohenbuehelia grisea]|uniref:Uncharacterized protein n=1 Tax=Hohenbuehelia grisea TaxID=104357 RepID=A0ABR3JJA2_9AGAR
MPIHVSKSKRLLKSHGYWKDLLNILALATLNQLSHVDASPAFLHTYKQGLGRPNRTKVKTGDRDARIEAGRLYIQKAQAEAKASRVEAAKEAHQRIEQKLALPKYRALYIAVARLFAERLAQDLRLHEEIANLPAGANRLPLLHQISLAAKWAPSPHLSHDRQTNIATAIALILQNMQVTQFPTALTQEDLPARTHAAILRSFFQRWVLRPLREISVIPEPLMSANKWTEIKYSRVSSLSMKLHQAHFFKHDPEGFERYLLSVEEGKTKISGATLLPHELIAQVVSNSRLSQSDPSRSKMPLLQAAKQKASETQLRVVEAQWKALIDNLRASGTIENSIAVCDVSASMGSVHGRLDKKDVQPIFPAVALSLVLARLSKPPFANGFHHVFRESAIRDARPRKIAVRFRVTHGNLRLGHEHGPERRLHGAHPPARRQAPDQAGRHD